MKKGFWQFALLVLLSSVAHAQSETVTYFYTDPQGTILAETDASGNVTANFDYRPYGSIALGNARSGPGYTGHVNDPDVGLVYMQARYYDPAAGRFLSIDPVAPDEDNDWQHFNRYAYAYNNPIRFTDPDGRCPICIGLFLYFTMDNANAPGPKDTPSSMSTGEKMGAIASALPPVRAVSVIRTTVDIGRKASTIAQNVEKGKAGEAATRAKLGDKVAGEQVTFKTNDGTRTRADFVTKDGGVVETKTGNAQLSTGQAKLQSDINAGLPVTPVGNNAKNAGLPTGQPTTMTSCTVDRQGC